MKNAYHNIFIFSAALLVSATVIAADVQQSEKKEFFQAIKDSNEGALQKAVDELKAVIKSGDAAAQKEAHFHLGIVYYKMKDYKDALTEFKIVESVDQKHALAYYFLGLVNEADFVASRAKADKGNAIAAWENYLRYADPSHKDRISYANDHLNALKKEAN